MSAVRSENDRSLPSQDTEPYEPPRADDVDVAAGTAEAATGAVGSGD
jgi:hypothetical protein